MTEIEIIARAQMYLEKLANGVNPLTDTEVNETDVVNLDAKSAADGSITIELVKPYADEEFSLSFEILLSNTMFSFILPSNNHVSCKTILINSLYELILMSLILTPSISISPVYVL